MCIASLTHVMRWLVTKTAADAASQATKHRGLMHKDLRVGVVAAFEAPASSQNRVCLTFILLHV